jgi:hypothetical protein
VKQWYRFSYHGGHKVTIHQTTEAFVERTRRWAVAHKIDLVITEVMDS